MTRTRAFALAAGGLALAVAVLCASVDCGTTTASACPLPIPTDGTSCNSGGVVVYCHYDCTADAGTTYFATCSGARWSVVASGVDCATDSGAD